MKIFNDPFYYDKMQQFVRYQAAFFKLYKAANDIVAEARRCVEANENYGADFDTNLLHLDTILMEAYQFYNIEDKQWRDGLIKQKKTE